MIMIYQYRLRHYQCHYSEISKNGLDATGSRKYENIKHGKEVELNNWYKNRLTVQLYATVSHSATVIE